MVMRWPIKAHGSWGDGLTVRPNDWRKSRPTSSSSCLFLDSRQSLVCFSCSCTSGLWVTLAVWFGYICSCHINYFIAWDISFLLSRMCVCELIVDFHSLHHVFRVKLSTATHIYQTVSPGRQAYGWNSFTFLASRSWPIMAWSRYECQIVSVTEIAGHSPGQFWNLKGFVGGRLQSCTSSQMIDALGCCRWMCLNLYFHHGTF